MRFHLYLILFVVSLPLFSWAQSIAPSDTALRSCLSKANQVLDEAFHFMQKNYYRRGAVDWDTLQLAARQRLARSGNCSETYDIISDCFRQLNERHSFMMSPMRAAKYNNVPDPARAELPVWRDMVGEIKAEWLDHRIAYLTVPWVNTTDSLVCTRVADSLQQIIAEFDGKGASGWIIDLRKNTGGNCWPMLAGIGPLLGNGVCGYFVNERERVAISYTNGAASQGKHIRCRVSTPAGYTLKDASKPIIVLTGKRTVSSGEIVALAFKGKETVSLYGEPTAGYTTANATYTLSDNSMLVLTVCMEADRTGKICEGAIVPDQHIPSGSEGQDAPKDAAIMWISSIAAP